MPSYSAPPGYRRKKPVRRAKPAGFTGIIDTIEAGAIVAADESTAADEGAVTQGN